MIIYYYTTHSAKMHHLFVKFPLKKALYKMNGCLYDRRASAYGFILANRLQMACSKWNGDPENENVLQCNIL